MPPLSWNRAETDNKLGVLITRGEAFELSQGNPLFGPIQAECVAKPPWEFAFFTDPKVRMYHIRPLEVMCPEKYRHP
jgi:hypothetical protein